jgi:hypothetical protein
MLLGLKRGEWVTQISSFGPVQKTKKKYFLKNIKKSVFVSKIIIIFLVKKIIIVFVPRHSNF